MKDLFNPICDRHGHILTGVGGLPEVMLPFILPSVEEITLLPESARIVAAATRDRQLGQIRPKADNNGFHIRRILVPVDSEHTKPADLIRVVELARRFDAQITFLQCYETPRAFSFAKGDAAVKDVIWHQEQTKAHLRTLCSRVRKSWTKCLWLFEFGSLPEGILRVSKRIRADLIAVPLPLSSAGESWSNCEILDELARKADCAVLVSRAAT
jgi:nucleotide-binding universal stress UspA family protein